jgi:tRNA (guanine10-N2)-dimethyltransferase
MMLFVLNERYLDLAAAEAKAASCGWGWWERKEMPVDSTLLLDGKKTPQHLGLTRRVLRVLATTAVGNLKTTLSSVAWNSIIGKKSYKLVLTKEAPSNITLGELTGVIWRSLTTPNVDVESPGVTVEIVITSVTTYIGIVAWENTEDFEARRAHLLPASHPSMTHPAIARAMLNLSCAASIHDPFCGSGGFLIEGGLAHKRMSGSDISAEMLARAKTNCAHCKLHPPLRIADAVQWLPRVQAIVTDLPYGRSTRPVDIQPLLHAFLVRAAQSTKRVVVGLPCQVTAQQGWKARAHMELYIHKSLTKHLYVLERA